MKVRDQLLLPLSSLHERAWQPTRHRDVAFHDGVRSRRYVLGKGAQGRTYSEGRDGIGQALEQRGGVHCGRCKGGRRSERIELGSG